MEDLQTWIEETLPGEEGWWKSETADDLIDAAATMAEQGMDAEDIKSVLTNIVTALRNEYGD